MTTRRVIDAKDKDGEKVYVKGHAKATYMSDGRTVDEAVNNKVDKVDGKQLSTEDFTTLLKQKLDGLSNYDDTDIQAAVSKLRTDLDTLVSGDTTTAIKTFNEVIAFLYGISDTENLSGIISSIEQQIAAKQDKITDLQTIREGAAKGATAIQSHQDISGKQDKLVSGTNIKTINGESILGRGDITIQGGSGGGSAAYPIVNHGTSDTTFTLTPNTFHVWGEVSSLDLSFGAEQAGVANEFLFQFASGATATSLTLPDDIKWANDTPPTIAENMIYQVSILNGMASVLEFDNEPEVTTISFKIRNYECIAEEGMTWEQWVSSEYNTVSCAFMGNNIHRMGEMVGTSDTTYVTKTDAIISDFVYTLIYTT